MMKHSILIIALALLFCACKTQTPTVIEKEKIVYQTKDSIVYRDSTVYIPIESVKEVVPALDTLKMETSLAAAQAYLDTLNMCLRGQIKNKKAAEYQYIQVEKIITKDSLVEKEVPVPYPVVEKVRYTPTWMIVITFVGGLILCLFIGSLVVNSR